MPLRSSTIILSFGLMKTGSEEVLFIVVEKQTTCSVRNHVHFPVSHQTRSAGHRRYHREGAPSAGVGIGDRVAAGRGPTRRGAVRMSTWWYRPETARVRSSPSIGLARTGQIDRGLRSLATRWFGWLGGDGRPGPHRERLPIARAIWFRRFAEEFVSWARPVKSLICSLGAGAKDQLETENRAHDMGNVALESLFVPFTYLFFFLFFFLEFCYFMFFFLYIS